MDLAYTPEEEAFRAEVRTFLAEELPARLSDKVRGGRNLSKADIQEWQSILSRKGWLAPHWPAEYGGAGWSVTQKFIYEQESALAHTPPVIPFGLNMLAPVLIKYGSEEQKAHWLPRMLRGDDWWCQGYSEPGAGSDLASVRTVAVRDGDHYIVNGQKTWTTMGQHANMIFCLVRTDNSGSRQQGISFLLVDMTAPGVEVRPIITLDGDHEVNEIFFTDVRVPAENLLGEEGRGWTYAKYLLTYERTSMAGLGQSRAALGWLKQIAQKEKANGVPLARDPLFAARLARVEIALANLQTTTMRVVAAAAAGGAPGAESSMLKIRGTEIRQEISSLTRRAIGPYAQPFLPEALEDGHNEEPVGPDYAAPITPTYLNLRKLTIFGGSNEIQKNIITKAILDL
ncbi:acyl-CoA dehydrogenase family protein [Sphingomonas aliaeris]|uniref:Acyl-CoA dehydrogenase family protein n=1 Tax=Sphingomonas aliaeris TaxID=2759526 RepID=A0A974NTI4_9SPHN|nr:acyl-CoA dehydrogenase family protein [Sphingomonas aliaeris]QQV76715.1 acyl-CoA dehydrogenase family protein [Sphingomonas aliaeris]